MLGSYVPAPEAQLPSSSIYADTPSTWETTSDQDIRNLSVQQPEIATSSSKPDDMLAVSHPSGGSLGLNRGPRTRQRVNKPPPALDVPDINNDAAERKRVLNVLAQRRYRERKRQRKGKSPAATAHSASPTASYSSSAGSKDSASPAEPDLQTLTTSRKYSAMGEVEGNEASASLDAHAATAASSPSAQSCTTRRRWTRDPPLSTVLMPTLDPAALQYSACMSETTSSLMSQDMSHFSEEDEAALLACAASVPSALFEYPDLGLVTVQGACDSSLSLSSPSRSGDGSHATSDDEQTFPDSYLLPVTELILLRACGRIGERIQCNDRVWQLDATSTFVDGTMSLLSSSMLPPSWQPTQSQSTLPHHPIVDLLPWPSVRDRLLLIMSLPDTLKPATVGMGGMAVVQLAYDMEDSSEGLRIWGEDVYDSAAWEVGQVLFEKWWFVFDRQVIERSNYWRRMRGAPDLKLPSRVEELGG